MTVNLFLGPYALFLTPTNYPTCPAEFAEEWDRLLDDHERLEWNFSRGSPPSVIIRGESMWAWCAVPIAARENPPRWPMLNYLESRGPWDFLEFDLTKSEPLAMCVCRETAGAIENVSPQSERDWFAAAYAEELRLLERIFGQAPILRWGIAVWNSG